MELLGESVGSAAGTVMQHIHDLGGEGGLIAIGPRGEVSMPFNTSGMYRASIDAWGKRMVGVL
jgi:beta-aspartyl-peptidase (threonine type)